MNQPIDLRRTIYDLTRDDPALAELLARLGFPQAQSPSALRTGGKMTDIPKAARLSGIDMEEVLAALREAGYGIPGLEEAPAPQEEPEAVAPRGDDPAERVAAAEKEIGEELRREELRRGFASAPTPAPAPERDYSRKNERAAALEGVPGHPLRALTRENEALAERLSRAKAALASGEGLEEALEALSDLSVHYAKKGDLLYPLLKTRYAISGPSDVLWTVDDEIRDALAGLRREDERGQEWRDRFGTALQRAEEMIFKEQNILFPICAVNFTEEEWRGIERDSRAYGLCFGVEEEPWADAAPEETPEYAAEDGEIRLPGGHLTPEQLAALLNTIPMEITFVDAEDVNRFFNEGPKLFQRPGMALDREVYSCHPPKVEAMVRSIIGDFRAGRRDSVQMWMEKGGRTVLVTYRAVRDRQGAYLGTVELVQDMEFAKARFQGGE